MRPRKISALIKSPLAGCCPFKGGGSVIIDSLFIPLFGGRYLNSKLDLNLSLIRQGLSEHEFYGDLVYKLKKIVGSNNFSAQFIRIISHCKKIGYNVNVLQ